MNQWRDLALRSMVRARRWCARGAVGALALTLPLWVLFGTIAVVGMPGTMVWLALWVVVGGCAMGSWWWVATRSPDRPGDPWRGFLKWLIIGEVGLLAANAAFAWIWPVAVSVPAASPIGVIVLMGLGVLAVIWVRWPRAQPMSLTWAAAWAHREAVLTLVLATVAGLLIAALLVILVPWPTLVALATLATWTALAALWLGSLTRGAPTFSDLAAVWHSVPWRAGAGWFVAGNLAFLLLFGGNLLPAWTVLVGSHDVSAGYLWSQQLVSLPAIREGASAQAAGSLVAAETDLMTGHPARAQTALANAEWWAPTDPTLLPVEGWVSLWLPGRPGFTAAVSDLLGSGDGASADILMGLYASRRGSDGRPWFFDALVSNPWAFWILPSGIPAGGVLGLRSQAALGADLERESSSMMAYGLAQLDREGAWTAAVATDALWQSLLLNAPRPRTVSAGEWRAVALAAWHTGDLPLLGEAGIGLWQDARTGAQRQSAALLALSAASAPGYIENPASPPMPSTLLAWAAARPPGRVTLSLAQWQILSSASPSSGFNWNGVINPTVLPELARLAAARPAPVTIRQAALGLLAFCAVEESQWSRGFADAKRAERLGTDPSDALAWAALGYGLLDARGNAAASPARRDLLKAAGALPHDFMIWYTLAQLDRNTNHLARAAREAAYAVTLRDQLSADGDGGLLAVLGSQQEGGGFWPVINSTGPYAAMVSLVIGVASSIQPPITAVPQ